MLQGRSSGLRSRGAQSGWSTQRMPPRLNVCRKALSASLLLNPLPLRARGRKAPPKVCACEVHSCHRRRIVQKTKTLGTNIFTWSGISPAEKTNNSRNHLSRKIVLHANNNCASRLCKIAAQRAVASVHFARKRQTSSKKSS